MGEGLDRVNIVREDPFYIECLSLNDDRERDRLFCRHDYQHMLSVSQISYNIMNQTGQLDEFIKSGGLSGHREAREVIYAAGLLHDMARWQQYDTGEDHARAGAAMARAVLVRAGFWEKEIAIITAAIREHRKSAPGQSQLGRVMCLADDLSRPCNTCRVRFECYKYEYMENIKEKNHAGYVLDVC